MSSQKKWKPPPPDWNRVLVRSRAGDNITERALGDTSRWGGNCTIDFNNPGPGLEKTQQLLRVQVEDGVPRQWQMAGTLEMPATLFPGGGGPGGLQLVMAINMGAGQSNFTHRILLPQLTAVAIGSTVYDSLTIGTTGYEQRPWIMGGGLTGLQLSVWLEAAYALLPGPMQVKWTGSIAPITAK